MQHIDVRPLDGRGWEVRVSGVENPLVFRSGARAEAAARALARRLAAQGLASELTITLRDGWVATRATAGPARAPRAAAPLH